MSTFYLAEEPQTILHNHGFWSWLLYGVAALIAFGVLRNRSTPLLFRLFIQLPISLLGWLLVWAFLAFVGIVIGGAAVSFDEKTSPPAQTSTTPPAQDSPAPQTSTPEACKAIENNPTMEGHFTSLGC